LQNPAFEASGTAAVGSARAIGGDGTNPIAGGNPLSTTAGAGGTADSYEATNSAGTRRWSGTVTTTGGGGDLQLNNPVLANGQQVQLTAWTHAQPA